ncbi:uncharacterized protein LOC135960376 [Calliphora vicina]|uniref:uncharacterized protein LOC135960376 n=1 Tax=Calliphora vicina TaxID=7373 RepID=UPI00325BE9A0
MQGEKETPSRNRLNPVKRWLRNEEISIINFIKKHPDFEKPTAQMYYNKFLFDTGIDANWKLVRAKVRNMRVAYRKTKEYGINKKYFSDCDAEAMRNKLLKICWYVDDFDVLFPNEMDSHIENKPEDPNFDDEFSNQKSISHINYPSIMINEQYPLDDEITSSSSSKSINGDILAVQTDMFKLKQQKYDNVTSIKQQQLDLLKLKQQYHDKVTSIKQQELDLAREKFNFEKEKFRQEFVLKEKEIESQERLKLMELQMKERIAMKELELKEKLALQSEEKLETSYNNVHIL